MDKLLKSDVNFQRVRDGRNALPFYFDLNLSTARSVAAGTHFIANVAGDSFYADSNPIDGNCVVHFQDTNLDRAAVPFYVSPGFIANVPFTQMLIENAAQPGKKIRITYGVDIDFQPGSVAQIAVSNIGGYTSVRPEAATLEVNNSGGMTAGTTYTVMTPAQNPNGAILLSAFLAEPASSTTSVNSLLAKVSAPATVTDGAAVLVNSPSFNNGTTAGGVSQLNVPKFIPAGMGLYVFSTAGMSAASVRAASIKAL